MIYFRYGRTHTLVQRGDAAGQDGEGRPGVPLVVLGRPGRR